MPTSTSRLRSSNHAPKGCHSRGTIQQFMGARVADRQGVPKPGSTLLSSLGCSVLRLTFEFSRRRDQRPRLLTIRAKSWISLGSGRYAGPIEALFLPTSLPFYSLLHQPIRPQVPGVRLSYYKGQTRRGHPGYMKMKMMH